MLSPSNHPFESPEQEAMEIASASEEEDNPEQPEEQDFRVTYQGLFFKEIDFEGSRIFGYAYIFLQLNRKIPEFCLHADQMRIHSVRIGKAFTDFRFKSPFKKMFRKTKPWAAMKKPLRIAYEGLLAKVDPMNSKGELVVKIPQDLLNVWSEKKNVLRVVVEFSHQNPKGGIHFRVPKNGSVGEENPDVLSAHMFCTPYYDSARSCFPCIDAPWALCHWELAFIIPENMLAVASGEMVHHQLCGEDLKYAHFRLNVPTRASNIAFAVGHFNIYIHRFNPRVTSFCLYGLGPNMRKNCHKTVKIIRFIEKYLGSHLPHKTYHQVFVDGVVGMMSNHAGITIFDHRLLHPPGIIEQRFQTSKFLALAAAQQFFGFFLQAFAWEDRWACEGVARFVAGIYIKKRFGENFYLEWIRSMTREVIAYEKKNGGIVMDWSRLDAAWEEGDLDLLGSNDPFVVPYYLRIESGLTSPPHLIDIHAKKAHLVVRVLDAKIGTTILRLALRSLAWDAHGALKANCDSGSPPDFERLEKLAITAEKLQEAIDTVSPVLSHSIFDDWVYKPGHARFVVTFKYGVAQMTCDVEIKQYAAGHTYAVQERVYPYIGKLELFVQEIEGCHKFIVDVNGPHTRARVPLCSEPTRPKKRQVRLWSGVKVRMNLSKVDDEDPTLWLKLDPHYKTIREVTLYQPDEFISALIRFDRDAVAQLDAIEDLLHYPSVPARKLLMEIVANPKHYISVRRAAAYGVVHVSNRQVILWNGSCELAQYFRCMYGSGPSGEDTLLRPNDFRNFPRYFLQKTIPLALARLRGPGKLCPPGVIKFLLTLLEVNNNRWNRYSDDVFKASVIDALAESANVLGGVCPFQEVREVTHSAAEKIQRTLNMARSYPTYRSIVSVACLNAIFTLQKKGILFPKTAVYRAYAQPGVFVDLRIAAVRILVDLLRINGTESDFMDLLDLAISDEYSCIRHAVVESLLQRPPFVLGVFGMRHRANTTRVCYMIWQELTSEFTGDTLQRNDFLCLWETMYGSNMSYVDVVAFLRFVRRKRYVPPRKARVSSDENMSVDDSEDEESMEVSDSELDSVYERTGEPARAQRVRWVMGTAEDDDDPPMTFEEIIPKVIVREEGKLRHFVLHEQGLPIVCSNKRCGKTTTHPGGDKHFVCKSARIGFQEEPWDGACLICNVEEKFWPAPVTPRPRRSGVCKYPSFTMVPDNDIRTAWRKMFLKAARIKPRARGRARGGRPRGRGRSRPGRRRAAGTRTTTSAKRALVKPSIGNPQEVGYHIVESDGLKLKLRKNPPQQASVGVLDANNAGDTAPKATPVAPRRRRGRPPTKRLALLAQAEGDRAAAGAAGVNDPQQVPPTRARRPARRGRRGAGANANTTPAKPKPKRKTKKELEEEKFAQLERDASMGRLPLPVLNELPRLLGLVRTVRGYTVASGAPGYFTFEPNGWYLNIDGGLMNAGIRGRGRGRAAIKRKAEEDYGIYVPPDKKLKVPFPPWHFNRRRRPRRGPREWSGPSAAELAERRRLLHAGVVEHS